LRREYVSREWCEECGRTTPHRVVVVELKPHLYSLSATIFVLVECLKCGRVDILSTPKEVAHAERRGA